MFLVLLLWQTLIAVLEVPEYLVPRPTTIAEDLLQNASRYTENALFTSFAAIGGFFLAIIFAAALAVIFLHSRVLEMAVYPYAIALKSVPIVAIAPLLVIWFGNGMLPKVLVAALISFFPILVNSVKGLRAVDPEALDLFNSLSATKFQILFQLRIPTAAPSFFSGLRISSTLSVIGAIVSEFAGADRGLGFLIVVASRRLNTPEMFSAIAIASGLGILFFYTVALTEFALLYWDRKTASED